MTSNVRSTQRTRHISLSPEPKLGLRRKKDHHDRAQSMNDEVSARWECIPYSSQGQVPSMRKLKPTTTAAPPTTQTFLERRKYIHNYSKFDYQQFS